MSEKINNGSGEFSLNTDSGGPWGEEYLNDVPAFNPEQKQEMPVVDDSEFVQEMIRQSSNEQEDSENYAHKQERERILADALEEQSGGGEEFKGKPIEKILQGKIDAVSEQMGKTYRTILQIDQVNNSSNSATERLEAQYEQLNVEKNALDEVLSWAKESRESFRDQTSESLTTEDMEKEKVLDPRVESLAIPLARDYAEKNYPKREDGTFEPAWRGVNGEKAYKNKSPEDLMTEGMSEADARAAVIDIANQPYNEYSEYWKEQNRGGAEFLIKLIDEKGADTIAGLDLQDEQTRSEYGDLIHENWLERNEWVKDPNYGDPNLAKPFAELSAAEQQKDIDQLGVTQEWLKSQS